MSRVALLGTGAMGTRVAARLLSAGHDVVVWNRDIDRALELEVHGASVAQTPEGATTGADFVLSMVRDDEASRQVWLDPSSGALRGIAPGSVAIESSTLTPGWVAALSNAVADRSAAFLDAPMVGSRPQAEAGALVYLVGGDSAMVDRARPILGCAGAAVHHAGAVGHGMAMKLAVNALFGIQVAALGELLGFLGRLGVDQGRALELLGGLAVASPALKGAAALIAAGEHAPLFPIDLAEKDLRYAVETAHALGAPVPATVAACHVFASATSAGFGDQNITAVTRMYLGLAANHHFTATELT